MHDCGTPAIDGCSLRDGSDAERIVLRTYVLLPLLPQQEDGTWVAPLKKFKACELRLVESVPQIPGQPVFRVELFDSRNQCSVESWACEEVEDAVAAYEAMIPLAEAFAAHPLNPTDQIVLHAFGPSIVRRASPTIRG
jgi:hypothetical protein